MAKKQSTKDLLNSLHILAGKLTDKEYKSVTQSMFRLYMGDKLGYKDMYDPQFVADINAVWQFKKEKKLKNKAKLYKLKVIKGGKDNVKSL